MQLHDLRRLAHKVGLLVMEHTDQLLVTNGGTAAKGLREATVGTMDGAMELVMAERNGRDPLLRGKY